MTLDEIKNISIKEYLSGLNIHPVKDKSYYGMYCSPFREDKNASMKVDYDKNLWIDFGTGEGGTIIDLAMRINNHSLNEVITELNRYGNGKEQHVTPFSFHRNNDFDITGSKEQDSVLQITGVNVLANPALLRYLKERYININYAKQYCNEVHYSANGRPYFAIGFRNNTGGYDLRSSCFQGCTSKDITTINNGSKRCFVFEGFIDFLSYLTLKRINHPKADILVLNSISTISKGLDYLNSHKEVYTFLDNDEGGRKTTELIKSTCINVYDQSGKFKEYKDINDILCGKKLPDSKEVNLSERKLLGKEVNRQETLKTPNKITPKKKPGRKLRF